MELFGAKLQAFIVIFIAGMAGGLLPMWLGAKPSGQKILNYGIAFTAGVFLGAGLLHMLPEAQDHFADIGQDVHVFAVIISAIGFMLVLFLEKVMISRDEHDAVAGAGVAAYILVFVLSIHSVITGVSLGLSAEYLQIMILIIVISLHKVVAAFALGVSFVNAQFARPKFITLTTIFSFTAPLGVMIGGLVANQFDESQTLYAEGIFDALAAGTFIYIAAIENIPKVFVKGQNRWLNFILLLAGFGWMASLLLFE